MNQNTIQINRGLISFYIKGSRLQQIKELSKAVAHTNQELFFMRGDDTIECIRGTQSNRQGYTFKTYKKGSYNLTGEWR